MTPITLRIARPSDAPALVSIYAPYVLTTAVTYEYDVPTVENFTARIENTLKKYPYLVAERDGEIIGYAYLGVFNERAAGSWAAEISIYLSQRARRLGAGRLLYEALAAIAAAQGIVHLNAKIAYSPDPDDTHLTRDSIAFHTHMGYRWVGECRHCGFKFGKWYSLVYMEKLLNDTATPPSPFLPFPALPREVLVAAGVTE
jgi:phosphinothricin acetyltransferase